MKYLLLSMGLFFVYFFICWATVYWLKPKVPRHYFLLYLIIFSAIYSLLTLPQLDLTNEASLAAWWSSLVLLILAGLTMWNTFYSILWGFSGGLLADFAEHPELLSVQEIIKSYQGPDDKTFNNGSTVKMDRMLKRRIPGLEKSGILSQTNQVYKVTPRGKIIAQLTKFLYWFFALGRGGGIVENE